ncbi:hypothetical protein WA158_008423 [Blastocystis sp. Blastoise]
MEKVIKKDDNGIVNEKKRSKKLKKKKLEKEKMNMMLSFETNDDSEEQNQIPMIKKPKKSILADGMNHIEYKSHMNDTNFFSTSTLITQKNEIPSEDISIVKKSPILSKIDGNSDEEKLKQRKERFMKETQKEKSYQESLFQTSITLYPNNTKKATDINSIVGTCTIIEKPFLRLITKPDPSKIRPLPVLKLALKHIMKNWRDNENYEYVLSQLKSIRQDLTVQNIQNKFTVYVYQTHARIALEKQDLKEFQQCLISLRQLYDLGIPGDTVEFYSYQLLLDLIQNNTIAINSFLQQYIYLIHEPCIQHSISVIKSIYTTNSEQFWILYTHSPNMSNYLIDNLIPKFRRTLLKSILLTYLPTLSFDYIQSILGFSSREDLFDYLSNYKFIYNHDSDSLDMKTNRSLYNSI